MTSRTCVAPRIAAERTAMRGDDGHRGAIGVVVRSDQ